MNVQFHNSTTQKCISETHLLVQMKSVQHILLMPEECLIKKAKTLI